MLDYIPEDGYTEDGFIAGLPRIHGDFRFSFRPMISEERSKLVGSSDKLSDAAYDLKCADAVKNHVKTWSLVDASGSAVPISQAVVRQLKPLLFSKLLSIVMGTGASDIDPTASEQAQLDAADAQYEAAVAGGSPGAIQGSNDEKN